MLWIILCEWSSVMRKITIISCKLCNVQETSLTNCQYMSVARKRYEGLDLGRVALNLVLFWQFRFFKYYKRINLTGAVSSTQFVGQVKGIGAKLRRGHSRISSSLICPPCNAVHSIPHYSHLTLCPLRSSLVRIQVNPTDNSWRPTTLHQPFATINPTNDPLMIFISPLEE